MSKVFFDVGASLDAFIAGPNPARALPSGMAGSRSDGIRTLFGQLN